MSQRTNSRFHLFRHGETDWNREERFQGHIDVPLNDRGREQAREVARRLRERGAKLDAVISSDLSRAWETAEIVVRTLASEELLSPTPLELLKHTGLREAHLGEAQGLTHAEIEARYGTELITRWRSWRVTDADVSYPGGETGAVVLARVLGALEELALARPELAHIGVATHGGVIRRVMQKLLPPGSDPVPIPNGVIYTIAFDRETREFSLAQELALATDDKPYF